MRACRNIFKTAVLIPLFVLGAGCAAQGDGELADVMFRGLAEYDTGGGVVYVAAGATGTPDGTAVYPYASLGAAVAALSGPNQTILIGPGKYDEPAQIIIDKPGTRLIGYLSDPKIQDGFLTGFRKPAIIYLSYPNNDPFGHPVFGNGLIDVRASDVEIAGLEIRVTKSLNSAIRAGRPYDPGIHGIHIHHNQIETPIIGINFHRASGTIDRNRSVEPGGFGAYVSGDRTDEGGAQVTITRNEFGHKRAVPPQPAGTLAQAAAICFQYAINDQEDRGALTNPAIQHEAGVIAEVSDNKLYDSRAGVVIVMRSGRVISDATKESHFQGHFHDNHIFRNIYGIWVSAGATFAPADLTMDDGTAGSDAVLNLTDNHVHGNERADALLSFNSFFYTKYPLPATGLFGWIWKSTIAVTDPTCDFATLDVLVPGASFQNRLEVNGVELTGELDDASCTPTP